MTEWFNKRVDLPYFCVVGSPIAHSRSPFIHSAFAAQCGLELIYEKVEVKAGRLADAAAEFRAAGGRGLNVTVPLKEEAWALATRRMPRADRAGAANTLWFDGDEVVADNTDGMGLVCDLERNHGVPLAGKRILLLGAGGATRGALPALLMAAPARILVSNRTAERAAAVVAAYVDSGVVDVLPWGGVASLPCDVIINATTLSLQGKVPELDPSALHAGSLCYDMMYGQQPTSFLRWARARGVTRTIDGLGMLVEQAACAFALWHGRAPRTAAVIAELRAQLAGSD